MKQRALLFLDVDGTLLPFAGAARRPGDHANPLITGLDPEHGRRLAALPCDLAWATGWMAEANDVLAPPVKIGVKIGDEPAPAPIDGQQTSAPLIMIETDDTDVCAADGSGC